MHQGARGNDEAKKHRPDWNPHGGKKKGGKKTVVNTGHKNRYARFSSAGEKQATIAANGGRHITAADRARLEKERTPQRRWW